jgi:hypothetical protein
MTALDRYPWCTSNGGSGMIPRTRVPAATAILAVLIACDTGATFGSAVELPVGTWGGEDAGVIVAATAAHVHVGCTNGDFPAPIALDEDGRFSVAGDYLLMAYPVAVGPTMPARFAGVVSRGPHGGRLRSRARLATPATRGRPSLLRPRCRTGTPTPRRRVPRPRRSARARPAGNQSGAQRSICGRPAMPRVCDSSPQW